MRPVHLSPKSVEVMNGTVPVPHAQGVGVLQGVGEVCLRIAYGLQPGGPARSQGGDRR